MIEFESVKAFKEFWYAERDLPYREIAPTISTDGESFFLRFYPLKDGKWEGSGCWFRVKGNLDGFEKLITQIIPKRNVRVIPALRVTNALLHFFTEDLGLSYDVPEQYKLIYSVEYRNYPFVMKYIVDCELTPFKGKDLWEDKLERKGR